MTRAQWALAVCTAVLVTASPVRAQSTAAGPPVLSLDLARCPDVSSLEVQNVVAVELRRPVVLVAGAGQATTVRVTCAGLRADITVDDALTAKTVVRSVDLAATAPVARPHLLALSIVELLAATWLELRSHPTAADASVPANPTTSAEREAALELVRRQPEPERAPEPPKVRAGAAAVAQISTSRLRSWGAAATAGGDPGGHVGWLAELAFLHGRESFALGSITADSVSLMGAVVGKVQPDPFVVRAGLGLRGGAAWMSGMPAAPPTIGGAVRGTWWGAVAVFDGMLPLGRRMFVGLTVEVGRVFMPVTATVQGDRPVAIAGTWLRGGVGVGLAL